VKEYVELTRQIIAACYEVHNVLGPGLQERFYRDALVHELGLRGLICEREQEIPVEYKGIILGKHRVDLMVEGKVLVELKAVNGKLQGIHAAQTVSERSVSKLPVALLVNFGDTSVQVRRFEAKPSSINPPIS
jgi:GxxExxY protein